MYHKAPLNTFYWRRYSLQFLTGLLVSIMPLSHASASTFDALEFGLSANTADKSAARSAKAGNETVDIAQIPGDEPTPEPQPLPPDEDPVVPVPQPSEPVPDSSTQIEVRSIQVTGSTVFAPETLQAAVAPFENRVLTLAELQQAAAAITELYLQEGYITSRAIVPDQTTDDGIIQILVIEGSIADIEIEGTGRLERYVRDRVALGTGTPLNQFELEDQLRLLQFDPLFDEVDANLGAGEALGESVLTVNVDEAEPFRVSLVADNYLPDSLGRERLGANLSYLNPLGLGDEFFTSAYVAPSGGSYVYELGYRVPLNAKNGTLQFRFVPSEFNIVDSEAANIPEELDIKGSADLYQLSFRQPLIRTPREELALSLGFRHRIGETFISDFLVDDSAVSIIQFGQDYLRRDTRGAWAFQSQFNIGTGFFDATISDSSADSRFLSWQGQAQRVQLLGPNNTLVLQADLQLSDDPLLGSEQFILGGGQSVRGYQQNIRAADNGFRFSVEDRIVLLRDTEADDNPLLQLTPFVDLGVVWNNRDNDADIDDNFLLGTGLGVIITPIPELDIRVDLGFPLIDLDDPGDPESVGQIYFQVVFSPQRR